MYEEATVLGYENRKIWIKHISQELYCVNGCYISFCKEFDLTDVSQIADMLDWYYSPFYAIADSPTRVLICSYVENHPDLHVSMNDLQNSSFDVSSSTAVQNEYNVWKSGRTDIYINDGRDRDVSSWLDDE